MRKLAVTLTFCIVLAAGVCFVAGAQESGGGSAAGSPAESPKAAANVADQLTALVGKAVRIVTSGGGQFQGTLLSVGEERVELRTSEGLIQQIWKRDIVQVLNLEVAAARVTYFQDAAESRLLFMPTGFPLPKHEFQVTDEEIALVTASYGVTDYFSLWGGVTIPGAVVNARFSLPIGDTIGLSTGALVGFSWLIDSPSGIALPYVIASFGSPNQNFTFGASVPFYASASTAMSAKGAIAALAGKVVVSSTASIVTENWFYVPWNLTTSMSYVFPAVAFRIAGSRFSWDIGAVVPLRMGKSPSTGRFVLDGVFDGTVIPIPLLSIAYRL